MSAHTSASTNAHTQAAVGSLLALLECRYAMRVLWALRDGHPQTFRLLQDSVGSITPNTLNTRLKDLREAGFVVHNDEGYLVTPAGADLLRRLSELQTFAVKWTAQQARKPRAAVSARSATASPPPA